MADDFDVVWSFHTPNFRVQLEIETDYNYRYDGDDEDGSTQAALDAGDMVAFNSAVVVYLNCPSFPDDVELGRSSLCGSVYYRGQEREFWTAHRDPNPDNRNCTLMRAKRGQNVSMCHYFPGMVQDAILEARANFAKLQLPRLTAGRGRRAASAARSGTTISLSARA